MTRSGPRIGLLLLALSLSLGACSQKSGEKTEPERVETTPKAGAKAGNAKPALKSPAKPTQTVDHRDPKSVARAALAALKTKDVEALVALVPTRWMPKARESWRPAVHGEHRFFRPGSWQRTSAEAWDGRFHGLRRRGRVALVKYGELGKDAKLRHLCVSLVAFGNAWFFKNLDDRPQSAYDRYSAWDPSKPPAKKK